MTANEALKNAQIRHQIYLLRYSGYIRNQMIVILQKTEEEIRMRVLDGLSDTVGLESPSSILRMKKIQRLISELRSNSWSEANEFLIEQMKGLSIAEPTFAMGIFASVSPVVLDMILPPSRQVLAIATQRPFEGRILSEWAETMKADDIRRIHSAIQMGMLNGEDSKTISRRIVGSTSLNGSDGITQLTRRQIETVTRTAVQSVANGARDEFFKDNSDIIEAEIYVATLDSRTTPICRAMDGKRFPVGEGPKPPLHFACRSLRVAAFDGEHLGFRPAKSSTRKQLLNEFTNENKIGKLGDRDDLPRGFKGSFDEFERKRVRELTGRAPAATSYQEWLKTQTKAFQDEVLGVTRAKLFRDGGLTLDKHVTVNGSELTLKQLAQKYTDEFKKAGLNPVDFK